MTGVAALLVFFALDFGETARRLPLLVGASLISLLLLDLLSRLPGTPGAVIRSMLGAGFDNSEMQHIPDRRTEIVELVWVGGCVFGIAVAGYLLAIPVYVMLYGLQQGKLGWTGSILLALATVAVIGIVFEVLLDYQLYRGMLYRGILSS